MPYTVRPARAEDEPAIQSFTRDTFDWGDYVGEAFRGWVDNPGIHASVVVDESGTPVAVGTAKMPAPREVWLGAARVHPDHRGHGLGAVLNEDGVTWGRKRGARVARLLIEDWNEVPQRQVSGIGYRRTSRWVFARRLDLLSDPNPLRNGGPRVPGPERLVSAEWAEVDEAWVAWSSGGLLRASRGLLNRDWVFWTMTPDDLVGAKRRGELWSCPSGWVIGASGEDGKRFEATWMQAAPADFRRVIRACIDHAVAASMSEMAMWLPADPDLVASLESLGFELSPSSVWEHPIG